MTGIFGDLFDFDGDGKLNSDEQFADFLAFNRLVREDKHEAKEPMSLGFVGVGDLDFDDGDDDDFDDDSDDDFDDDVDFDF